MSINERVKRLEAKSRNRSIRYLWVEAGLPTRELAARVTEYRRAHSLPLSVDVVPVCWIS